MATEIECAGPYCTIRFVPSRPSHRFHNDNCRHDYHRHVARLEPHPCPLCTIIHDPEERAVLDALALTIRNLRAEVEAAAPVDRRSPREAFEALALNVEALIARRRAILRGAVV